MKNKKFLLVMSMICTISIFMAIAANASANINPQQTAVYLNNKFYGNSAIINGDIYTANGDVEFSSSGSNMVSGKIYYKSGNKFILPDWLKDRFSSKTEVLNSTSFGEVFPVMKDFPVLTKDGGSINTTWDNAHPVITESARYDSIKIQGGRAVTVDTSHGDIILVVDNLEFIGSGTLYVQGSGKLILCINNSIVIPNNSCKIENGNNPEKTYILTKNNPSFSSGTKVYANIFSYSTSNLTVNGYITGRIITKTNNLTLTSGNAYVEGLVYAPYAAVTAGSPGVESNSITIKGRIVAKSLSLSGNGRIDYDGTYAAISIPQQFVPAVVRSVSVSVNDLNAGTAIASKTEVNDGDVIHISVTAKPGFKFVGFTSPSNSPLPDANGDLVVSGNIDIVANFEEEEVTPPVSEYVNGLLGEYYDASELYNDSALRMKRIDSKAAFNFIYDSPHSVIEPDTFAIRWTGYIKPEVTGDYYFKTYSDDGVKLTIDGKTIINRWGLVNLEYTVAGESVRLDAGTYYPVTLEYQEQPLNATVFLFWEADDVPMSIVPDSVFFVKKDVYEEYKNAKFFNALERSGTGLKNVFYVTDDKDNRVKEYTETKIIDYKWGLGAPGDITEEAFYGTMDGYIEAKYTEATTLGFIVDDGIRVWIDDKPVIDEWTPHSEAVLKYTFNTVVGQKYKIHIEYVDYELGATCIMFWQSPLIADEVIPAQYLYSN